MTEHMWQVGGRVNTTDDAAITEIASGRRQVKLYAEQCRGALCQCDEGAGKNTDDNNGNAAQRYGQPLRPG